MLEAEQNLKILVYFNTSCAIVFWSINDVGMLVWSNNSLFHLSQAFPRRCTSVFASLGRQGRNNIKFKTSVFDNLSLGILGEISILLRKLCKNNNEY